MNGDEQSRGQAREHARRESEAPGSPTDKAEPRAGAQLHHSRQSVRELVIPKGISAALEAVRSGRADGRQPGKRALVVIVVAIVLAVALVAGVVLITGGEGDRQEDQRASSERPPRLELPSGVEVGPDSKLYIVERTSRVRRFFDGSISTVAGNGSNGFAGDRAPAIHASLWIPSGIDVASDGTIYIADTGNHRIRRIGPDGIITTVAGNGNPGFGGDGGPATDANLNLPSLAVLTPGGSLLITDWDNKRIRRVGPDGSITTVAGNGTEDFGGDGGPATQAGLGRPSGVAVASDGSIYITDWDNNRIRRVDPDGTITTVAGNGTKGFGGDGGPAIQASLNNPSDIAVSPDGALYFADHSNHRIRRVDANGTIMTVAGTGRIGLNGDGGLAPQADLHGPDQLAFAPDGGLLITDSLNNRIRRVDRDGIITTVV